jgi:transcriptional regulator of nitric oxide reductase
MNRFPMIASSLTMGMMLGASVPAIAQPASSTTEKVNIVIVYGEDACPQSKGDDIVVCARKGEEERYRIPEPLRGDPNMPSHQAWGERVRSMEYVGASGTESCSPVGAGGTTGCFTQLARLAKAERQAADNASWKDLVEAERAKRLSTIDADSKAIEERVKAEEKAEQEQKGTPPQP